MKNPPVPSSEQQPDQQNEVKPKKVYKKPQLQELGLLRLVTKFSF